MAIRIGITAGGARLGRDEVDLLVGAAREHGAATLLVPGMPARDAARRDLARAGAGLGIDVRAVGSWLEGLWGLMGDGRRIVAPLERRLLMESLVGSLDAAELEPLRANPGTVRLLCDMASELLGLNQVEKSQVDGIDASAVIGRVLGRYAEMLDARGLVEPSQAAAEVARRVVAGLVPARLGFTAVRDADRLPAYLLRLLSAAPCADGGAELVFLLDGERSAAAPELMGALRALGCDVAGPAPLSPDGAAPLRLKDVVAAAVPALLEVEGPHARDRALAEHIARAVDAGAREVAVVSARPAELFDALAPRLAVRGIESTVRAATRFSRTEAGRQLAALTELAARMDAHEKGRAEAGVWWPAPELADWLASPLSGAGATFARQLDKKLRGNRALDPEAVMRQLQSVQGRVSAARKKLAADDPRAAVPAVCADVFSALRAGKPVTALKGMLAAAQAQPASAFGTLDGRARGAVEVAALRRAIEVLADTARALGVGQDAALRALEGVAVSQERACRPAEPACASGREGEAAGTEPGAAAPGPRRAAPRVRILTAREAACLEPASVDALVVADMDAASYPLAHAEGPLVELSRELAAPALELEPMACLRVTFARALAASRAAPTLARVTHDRQAKTRYPSAVWTEVSAQLPQGAPAPVSVGERHVVADLDPAGAEGLDRERIGCLPPQELTPEAVAYLTLRRRDPERPEDTDAPLVPRLLSASQIESYLTCPLCWFVSNRVRPARIDAGFGNMEVGNLVHDVLYAFHTRLMEAGVPRVTRENVEACLPVLREVFAEVRAEHARGKTSSSAACVPLTAGERMELDRVLPMLEAAVRYESAALAPFSPAYLEYSFNSLGLLYAGRPLGGRIDRVDVDAEGRAAVIDYKHRADASQFRVADPTVPNRKGEVPADDPDWLPSHTQTLIYAQALRRSPLGLDPRAALYFVTKGGRPSMGGAVAAGLAEVEPGDGRVPGLKKGFPNEEECGTMDFDMLLDRVEEVVRRRLDALDAGDVRAAPKPAAYCAHNHQLGFTRRNA